MDACFSLVTKVAVRPEVPRVLLLDHTAELGGGEIALLNLVRNLDTSRHVPVVLLLSKGPLEQLLADAGVETRVLPLSDSILHARKDSLGGRTLLRIADVFRCLLFCVHLARWIRSNNIVLVHANSLKADLIGAVAARLAGVPIIWHLRDRISRDYLPGSIVVLFRRACRVLPNVVVANSAATLTTVQPAGSAICDAKGKWRVIHDGTPWTSLPAVGRTGVLSSEQATIGIVGRISPWKGQHVFLRAVASVRQCFPQARFKVIGGPLFGESSYEQSLFSLCAELGLDDVVEFTGFCKNISNAIGALDILVHASTLGEPFGQVIIEAMALGKPVVATRGGGVPEIVAHGITGLLVPMNDPESLATALAELLSDPDRRIEMGIAGRRRVCEQFSIERVATKVTALYDEFLGPRICSHPTPSVSERP